MMIGDRQYMDLSTFFTKNSKKNRKMVKKWQKQRATQGFSDLDVGYFGSYLFTIMLNATQDLRKRDGVFPSKFKDKTEWYDYLDMIINSLKSVQMYDGQRDSIIDTVRHFDDNDLKDLTDLDKAKARHMKTAFELWADIVDDLRL